MKWTIVFHDEFNREFSLLDENTQDELLAHAFLLEHFGPQLGRPYVDTLKNSKFSNMKELRFSTENGVWRVAFAYDPKRRGILLVAGNKKGKNEKQFYNELIRRADRRFARHIAN